MCTAHSAVHIKKWDLEPLKETIVGSEEVRTGPSSEEINHSLFSLHYGSFSTDFREGFPVKALTVWITQWVFNHKVPCPPPHCLFLLLSTSGSLNWQKGSNGSPSQPRKIILEFLFPCHTVRALNSELLQKGKGQEHPGMLSVVKTTWEKWG